ncbi:hypothetical protein GGP41_007195 [Bipolaris sorokiniana]|uniref:Uncharacterized protein n=1 Tax=Cochliobolus sativus TaxID=45130 RepID=A0A8H5ZRN5_COCSA|nr:hypothetical protein GGP41_007195 [Bipolaris sorokiniana]
MEIGARPGVGTGEPAERQGQEWEDLQPRAESWQIDHYSVAGQHPEPRDRQAWKEQQDKNKKRRSRSREGAEQEQEKEGGLGVLPRQLVVMTRLGPSGCWLCARSRRIRLMTTRSGGR